MAGELILPQPFSFIMKYIIYSHTNKANGKVYIGQTCLKPNIRWKLNGSGYKTGIIKKAIEKYGWDNFIHEILISGITKEEADFYEAFLIKIYKSLNLSYNITDGGEGTVGYRHSEEARALMS